ncbi:MAG: tyrosine-protein phosphatase [Adlercreutzia equolifaciens]
MTTEEKRVDEEVSPLDMRAPFPGFGHIPFQGLHNTRDLGGVPAPMDAASRRRNSSAAGAFTRQSEQGYWRGLMGDYDLAGVIDFRTQLERDKRPDPRELMEGVVFYDFPALSGETVGITHGAGVAQDLKTFASYNASPHELVRGMYPQILLTTRGGLPHVVSRGAWKATVERTAALLRGQDRAGLGAVIVERALGVPEAYVRADYLATNLFARNRAEGIVDAISKKLGLMKGLDADIDSLFYAYNDYYDCAMAAVNANYGSFDAYLAEALDFGPEKRQALRAKYLR